jgi:hypothetical protein
MKYRVLYSDVVPVQGGYVESYHETFDEAVAKVKELAERDLKDDTIEANLIFIEQWDPNEIGWSSYDLDTGDDLNEKADEIIWGLVR